MTANYLPIFKAKPGELEAISHAKNAHAKKILPLFEVGKIGKSIREAARFKGSSALTCDYLDETAERIAAVRSGKSAMVDAFQWAPDAVTESGEHVLPYIYSKLRSLGVNVVPVVGYDRWDSLSYRLAMQGLEPDEADYFCLRLDSHAVDDSADPEYFEEQIIAILDDLNLEPARCAVLIDFGDITAVSLEELITQAYRMIEILAPMEFRFFAISGCSLPTTIDRAVPKPNSAGKVIRKEMLLWQTLKSDFPGLKCLFGDYGVRGPNTAEDIISPDTNGKIRHTIGQNYFIVRGHSLRTGEKGAQMHKLAKFVVDSSHYMGEGFSWGDSQILSCSQAQFAGNSTTWIAIDTSHHIAWVIAEVEEFARSLSVPKTTVV